MSYSRWSNSVWYTFWSNSRTRLKEEQIFEVCSVVSFKYKEIKENINGCIATIKKLSPDNTIKEFKELKRYMKTFIAHVNSDPAVKYCEELRKGLITPECLDWIASSEGSAVKELEEAIIVIETPLERIPLLMHNVESPLAKELIMHRLKITL